jgi:hypothetical protein
MRKLVVLVVGLFALATFMAMPISKALALQAPRPDCLGQYLQCITDAWQNLICCAQAQDPQLGVDGTEMLLKKCDPIKAFVTPNLDLRQESCRQSFKDDVNSCDDDFEQCRENMGQR